jgi:lantibiotic modifying enzyme
MIVIKNGLSHGDRYTDIMDIHHDIFEKVGWTAGCLVVNIHWFTQRLKSTNCESERYEEYKNKLKDYTERLEKLSVSL